MLGFVVEAHEAIGCERYRSIHPAIVITELDFVYARGEALDDGADLATLESLLR